YLLLGVVIVANRRLPGMLVVGLGVLMNFLVIAANGGYMPIAPEALVAQGQHALAAAETGTHVAGSKDAVVEREQTRLWFLSDVITTPGIPFWQRSFSVGDVVLAVGLFCLVQGGMRRRAIPRVCELT
ncbi:MAG: DUF5317 domain-containing protein, partial [Chloroflexota bacterium]